MKYKQSDAMAEAVVLLLDAVEKHRERVPSLERKWCKQVGLPKAWEQHRIMPLFPGENTIEEI
jgi:hypothetical protein